MARIVKIVGGLALVVAGIAMLVLPGPGLVAIAIGAALALSQWEFGRRWLARARVRLRERFGSDKVREFERRIPDDVAPPVETEELRLQAGLQERLARDEQARRHPHVE